MHDFRRYVHKIGTVIPSILAPPPTYTGWNINGDAICQANYPPFYYDTAPVLVVTSFTQYPGNSVQPIIANYAGEPYQTLNIISFTAVDTFTNTPVPNAAKLYYLSEEVTSFPFSINMEGLDGGELTGLEVGAQDRIVCTGVYGSGYTAKLQFSVTDINGLTGTVQNFIYRREDRF